MTEYSHFQGFSGCDCTQCTQARQEEWYSSLSTEFVRNLDEGILNLIEKRFDSLILEAAHLAIDGKGNINGGYGHCFTIRKHLPSSGKDVWQMEIVLKGRR